MNHRERVITALHHEKPDRCPMQVSFTPEFADRLRTSLDLKERRVHNPHGGGVPMSWNVPWGGHAARLCWLGELVLPAAG